MHGARGSRSNSPRPTIGLLISRLDRGFHRAAWQAVADAARERDVNLICFDGGVLCAPEGFAAQANVLYDLVDARRVDGLIIWSGCLDWDVEPQEMESFRRRYEPLPVVSVGRALESAPSVLVDNYGGAREAVLHLLRVHGYHRIAFLRGPEGTAEETLRYRAYADALAEHGLPLDPALVSPYTNWERADGATTIGILVDERRLRPQVDLEAVVSADDNTAYGAMEGLLGRGIRVPDDVAVVGFNDDEEGRAIMPALTTVRQPLGELGRQAMGQLLALLRGEAVPQQVTVPLDLIVRRSCGCLPPAVVQAAAGVAAQPRTGTFAAALAGRREGICAEIARVVDTPLGLDACWAERLLDAFVAELQSRSSGQSANMFLAAVNDLLRLVVAAGGEAAAWQDVLSTLRRQLLPYLGDDDALFQAEDLWQQARVLIGETAQQTLAYHNSQCDQQAELLRKVGKALITAPNMEEFVAVAAQELPRTGIPGCYISIYEGPEGPAEWARLILAYDQHGRRELEPAEQRFLSCHLVPEGLLPSTEQFSMVVEPLYFREKHLGFALFREGPRDGRVYDVLREHISSALQVVLLFRDALQAREAAEKADQLKTRLLANVSHELRTPLNVILGYTQAALRSPDPSQAGLLTGLLGDLQHIQRSAEHLLRVINDLLDLSRAEIDELDLHPEIIDLRPFLENVFHDIADRAASQNEVRWRLELPERLPMLQADPVRLRQILLNLLSNAGKFTESGEIVLGAEVASPHLHFWVQDTGTGIPTEMQERIFEPFCTVEGAHHLKGIGLGLSITRRLVALHCGSMALDSHPGKGSTFHVYLPLPSLSGHPAQSFREPAQPVLLLIAAQDGPTAEIVQLSQRQGWKVRRLRAGDDIDRVLAGEQPAALALDLAHASSADRLLLQWLCQHPQLSRAPFILYGQERDAEAAVGITNLVVKPVRGETLRGVLSALCPPTAVGPVLIVDDDPSACELYQRMAREGLPGYPVCTADAGAAALAFMEKETPSLVILDLLMPEIDGFAVLDWMRATPRTRQVPVLILSGRVLALEDIARLEKHALVTLQSKDILSEEETVTSFQRMLLDGEMLSQHTSNLVKRAVAYFHQNYEAPLSRQEIAEAIGVNRDYLSRVFRQELGLSPWEYLHRYRIKQAIELLRQTNDSITEIALQVGFPDPAYFSRIFRKVTGMAPSAYREHL
jgi:signal transduction histidine kinase/DNA-binding LacI/PurR family transcriptional regulator/AraC-like DNA-binding protein